MVCVQDPVYSEFMTYIMSWAFDVDVVMGHMAIPIQLVPD